MVTTLCTSIIEAQELPGVYTNKSNLPRHVDTLYIDANGTFKYLFYYPADDVSEYYTGTWTADEVHLYLTTPAKESPDFVLDIYDKKSIVYKLVLTKAPGHRDLKGNVFTP